MAGTVTLGTPATNQTVGRTLRSGATKDGSARVICDAPELKRHLNTPWLRAWLAEHVGVPYPDAKTRGTADGRFGGAVPLATTVGVEDTTFARHALTVGATGGGKSRFFLLVVKAYLHAGHSALVLDPKAESVLHVAAVAREAGVPPERLTIVSLAPDGTLPTSRPGWNPLAAGVPLGHAVSDFVAALALPASAPRLADILTNALIVVGSHGLSLLEVSRFLQRDDYRDRLLRLPVDAPDPDAYAEARTFFQHEFAAWGKAERAGALSVVLRRIREFIRNGGLRAVLCAYRQTLDLATLWEEQRVILVHLDRTTLGDDGAKLLGSLLASLLFRTAVRCGTNAPVAVALCLDELFFLQKLAGGGGSLEEMLAIARSYQLRLLTACQLLDQLEDGLRKNILANTAVQVYFRLGFQDARLVAAALSAGAGERVEKVRLDVASRDRRTGLCGRTTVRCTVLDAAGRPLRVSPAAWEELRWDAMLRPGGGLDRLERFAAASGAGRLYVRVPGGGNPVALSRCVAGLPESDWWLAGPNPLRLVVSFPTPKVTGVERTSEADLLQSYTKVLQDLPVQHALLRTPGREPTVFRAADVVVPDAVPAPELMAYLEAAARANGQPLEEVARTKRERERRVEAVVSGLGADLPVSEQEVPGGSVSSVDERDGGEDREEGTGTADDGSIA
jgi:hypothetical protein